MSLSAEKALAARTLRATADRLEIPEVLVADEWRRLERTLEDSRSAGGAELVLIAFRRDIEERLSARFLHSPLSDVVQPPTPSVRDLRTIGPVRHRHLRHPRRTALRPLRSTPPHLRQINFAGQLAEARQRFRASYRPVAAPGQV